MQTSMILLLCIAILLGAIEAWRDDHNQQLLINKLITEIKDFKTELRTYLNDVQHSQKYPDIYDIQPKPSSSNTPKPIR